MKSGLPAKGNTLLNTIVSNRVSPHHKKVMKKAIAAVNKAKETPEERKERFERLRQANIKRQTLIREQKAQGIEPPKKEVVEPEPDEEVAEDEILTPKEKNLKELLLRVIKGFGGEKTILKMAKKSDSLKMVILKMVLNIEQKEVEARLRAKVQPGGGAGFYFVISGLNDLKKVEQAGLEMKHLGNFLHPSEPAPIDVTPEEEEKDEG